MVRYRATAASAVIDRTVPANQIAPMLDGEKSWGHFFEFFHDGQSPPTGD
jgi:hypothetical protein